MTKQDGKNRFYGRRVVAAASCVLAGMVSVGVLTNTGRAGASPRALPAGPMYGVTIDDISNVSQVEAANAALPYMPTTRVYLDPTEPASYYSSAVSGLDAHSYVMGEILDSSDMPSQTVSGEQQRVSTLLSTLGSSVDIWEVGNEVNGNWTGPYSTGSQMITNTYNQVSAAGGRTALTLYYNVGCGDGASELDPITYSNQYLPASVRDGLNYVLLSYYQTQCNNQVLSTSTVTSYMQRLHSVFPNARLGFGEVGLPNPITTSTKSTALSIIQHYYTLPINLPYYVGGYFYWYYDEDAIPYSGNAVWQAIASGMQGEAAVLPSSVPAPTTTTTVAPATTTTVAPTTTTTVAPTTTTTVAPTTTTVAPSTSGGGTSVGTSTPTTVAATSPVPLVTGAATTGGLLSPFSGLPAGNWSEGSTYGGWTELWTGYGSVGVTPDPVSGADTLSLSPEVSTTPSVTHAALVVSQASYASPSFTVPVRTVSQLRQNSTPNDWEIGWVLWDYTPDDSFYALVLKPDGWELDKEVKGAEYFLATGSSPGFAIGNWYNVSVSQSGGTISVSVNGTHIVTQKDNSFQSGSIGLYCEDSNVHYGDVTVQASTLLGSATSTKGKK